MDPKLADFLKYAGMSLLSNAGRRSFDPGDIQGPGASLLQGYQMADQQAMARRKEEAVKAAEKENLRRWEADQEWKRRAAELAQDKYTAEQKAAGVKAGLQSQAGQATRSIVDPYMGGNASMMTGPELAGQRQGNYGQLLSNPYATAGQITAAKDSLSPDRIGKSDLVQRADGTWGLASDAVGQPVYKDPASDEITLTNGDVDLTFPSSNHPEALRLMSLGWNTTGGKKRTEQALRGDPSNTASNAMLTVFGIKPGETKSWRELGFENVAEGMKAGDRLLARKTATEGLIENLGTLVQMLDDDPSITGPTGWMAKTYNAVTSQVSRAAEMLGMTGEKRVDLSAKHSEKLKELGVQGTKFESLVVKLAYAKAKSVGNDRISDKDFSYAVDMLGMSGDARATRETLLSSMKRASDDYVRDATNTLRQPDGRIAPLYRAPAPRSTNLPTQEELNTMSDEDVLRRLGIN